MHSKISMEDLAEYMCNNVYKVVESSNPRHPVDKLFIQEVDPDLIRLVPIDLSKDNVIVKLLPECYVEEDTIVGLGMTLKLVAFI